MVAQRWCRYSATCDLQKVRVAVRHRVAALACAAAALIPVAAACSDSNSNQSQSPGSNGQSSSNGSHGPSFPQCGGVTDETVNKLTQINGLVNTAKNSVGCQWLAGGGILGPHFSFSWYRGSPIGRERKT
jgi:hypothetical protein